MSRIAESWLAGRVVRLNMVQAVNRQYAEQMGVTTTPTFILFDAAGHEQQRWVGTAPALSELPDA